MPLVNLDSAVVLEAYSISPTVYDDWPVPPFAAMSVPATEMAPVVAVAGVSPVDPKLTDNTGADVELLASSFTTPALFLK